MLVSLVALFLVGWILRVHAIQANTPGPNTLVECQPAQLSWGFSEGPVQILVYPGGVTSGTPLETLPTVSSGTTVTWHVDLPAGVEYTLGMRDLATGDTSFTAPAFVSPNPQGDTSCEIKTGQQSSLPVGSETASSTPPAGTSGSTTQPPASGSSAGSTVPTPSTTTPGNGGFSSGPDASQSSAASTETTTRKRSSPIGAIVGAVCAVVVVGGIIGVVLYLRRRKRVRALPHAPDVHLEAMAEPAYKFSALTMSAPSGQTAVSTQLPPPRREFEPVRPPTIVISSGKRQPLVMSAQPEENVASAPTPQQIAALDEENAMLRAVIARMQASHSPPTDSGTLPPPPSYDSRSTYSA
ncbi:hypothetical protein EXIGLDRAFT_839110 [Exidia glandulosa HHB12029]|uniref:Fibronectin type-III domain-containing protein n=1 Tax=Exidia glandulosa HHB12029 TaxID=1314781 RepID=A0A165F9W9_EXIGL|nr:hypothetical protein EXIGLDRAFT_839110 [Exidia glandulosa HHB12029]